MLLLQCSKRLSLLYSAAGKGGTSSNFLEVSMLLDAMIVVTIVAFVYVLADKRA